MNVKPIIIRRSTATHTFEGIFDSLLLAYVKVYFSHESEVNVKINGYNADFGQLERSNDKILEINNFKLVI